MMVRPARVIELVDAAMAGMQPVAEQSTGDEVISATITLCRNAVRTAKDRGADPAELRRCIGLIYMECQDDKVQ